VESCWEITYCTTLDLKHIRVRYQSLTYRISWSSRLNRSSRRTRGFDLSWWRIGSRVLTNIYFQLIENRSIVGHLANRSIQHIDYTSSLRIGSIELDLFFFLLSFLFFDAESRWHATSMIERVLRFSRQSCDDATMLELHSTWSSTSNDMYIYLDRKIIRHMSFIMRTKQISSPQFSSSILDSHLRRKRIQANGGQRMTLKQPITQTTISSTEIPHWHRPCKTTHFDWP
jgi:hypothetical protein